MVLLLDADCHETLATALRRNHNVDLETLLAEKERLYLEAAVPGSTWAVVQAIARGAPFAALTLVGLFFSEGRRMIIDLVSTEQETATGERSLTRPSRDRVDEGPR